MIFTYIKHTIILYYSKQISISYLEIYNELIRDLLSPGGPLELREDNRGQKITVAGLSEVTAMNRYEVCKNRPEIVL